MKYVFDAAKFNKEWYKDVHHFKRIDEENIGIEEYSDIDWKTADKRIFIEMYWPRSEVGAIYGDEALLMLDICFSEEPKLILEIGRMNGTSTKLFAAISSKFDGKTISIDGVSSFGVNRKLSILNLVDKVELIEKWSPWLGELPDWKIDFLFIDGDHSFISIIVDYHFFNYYLKKGGIVAFHDNDILEVREAVAEIRKRDPLEEIGKMQRLHVFRKMSECNEKYFQVARKEE